MRFAAVLLVGTALAATPALAMQDTVSGRYDPHVRTVAYNAMNVVRIVGSTFMSTQIVFATTETITHIAIGDREAWMPEPTGNLLFLKPVEARQPTNMQVVTQRADGSSRSYQFLLIARGGPAPTPGSDKVADLGVTIPANAGEVVPFAVHFVYPEDARAEAAAKRQAAEAGASERLAESRLSVDYFYGPRNWKYAAQGSAAIEPMEVSDNGRLTAMRFPGNSPLPTIYTLAPDGQETIIPYTMRADVAVISTTAKEFRLRSGQEVLRIFNRGYDPAGTNPQTGTTSPEVVRSVRGQP
jgi:type IV secretion system protein VirB9